MSGEVDLFLRMPCRKSENMVYQKLDIFLKIMIRIYIFFSLYNVIDNVLLYLEYKISNL